MKALTHARLYTGDAVLDGQCLLIEGDKITGFCSPPDIPQQAERVDCSGLNIAPGLIDLQVNGGGNKFLNDDPTPEGIAQIIAAHRRQGTTGLLPTLISDRPEKRRAFVKAAQAVFAQKFSGFLGVHLEGPHLNPEKRGVHNAEVMAAPDVEDIALIRAPNKGVTLATLAPETLPLDMLADLARAGVIIAAGHSSAHISQIEQALAAGLAGFTHLFNAMEPLSARRPGVIGAALDDRKSWVSVIADGHHVHPALIRLALRAKPVGKVFLVSDAMPPAALAADEKPEAFHLYGDRVKIEQGVCLNTEGKLAGSAACLWDCVRHVHQECGIALEEALRMASLYPAAAIGLAGQYGQLAPGYAADLIAFDDALNIRQVWVGGYERL